MPGLDPGIHAFVLKRRTLERKNEKEVVDARVKPGHDGFFE
jgi:hypothetical protein